ncbi:acetate--CoA ligase family protein [Rhodococcoides fascians]|uniref:acetate--CoA ligase family protein n=1 Tax=Rhodococcoides fascians TaxID=1828 RepID=UPI00068E1128|nr:acetate--CoA ligase family protein [Rhodococcus fascians]
MSIVAQPKSSTLDSFRDPESVAVVGASDHRAKWGYWLARGALEGRARRAVWLINKSTEVVQGEMTYRALSTLPAVPELVVLCVPSEHLQATLDDALTAGSKAFLVITAGVVEDEIVRAKLTAHGARMIGPNSLGLFDASTELLLAWGRFTAGSLAIVSQSGQLGSEIANLAAGAGVGVSRFVSVGNQLDVTAREILDDLESHTATRIVALYLESFADGAVLVPVLQRLRAAGKYVLVLAAGASEASRRLAASHTGSMTSAHDVVDAACRAAGAVRVRTPSELVDAARYLSKSPLPRGRRIAVVSDSGGQGGVAADVCAALALDTPVMSEGLQRSLAELLPAGSSVSNPIDLAGAGEADLHAYAAVCERLAASGEVDSILVSGYLGCYGEDTPGLEAAEIEVVDRLGVLVEHSGLPLLVHSMSASSVAVERMGVHNIPTYIGVEQALRALAHTNSLAENPGRPLPSVRNALQADVRPGYWAARHVLRSLGVSIPDAALVSDIADVRSAAARLAGPYVLKAGWLAHKSEHGGVVLGLRDERELECAFDEMSGRLGPGEYVIEQMDDHLDVVEMIVGARRDRDFGPMISVGAGGTEAELWCDITSELAPVDRSIAHRMIASLRSNALLAGWRGRPAVAVDALVDIVVSASEAIAAHPGIDELEINPVRVSPSGAVAVDALIQTSDTNQEYTA